MRPSTNGLSFQKQQQQQQQQENKRSLVQQFEEITFVR